MDREDRTYLSEKILEGLLKHRGTIVDARTEINKYYLEHHLSHMIQEREFFKYITAACLVSVIISPFLMLYSFHVGLAMTGIVIDMFLIMFIILYVWSTLQAEHRELEDQQKMYNAITDETLHIIDTYLQANVFTKTTLKNLIVELENSDGTRKLNEELAHIRLAKAEKMRTLDHSGQFALFLFVSANIMFISSIVGYPVSYTFGLRLILLLILTLILTFSNFMIFLAEAVSKTAEHTKTFFNMYMG